MTEFIIIDLQMFAAVAVQTTETGAVNTDTSNWGGTGLKAEIKTYYDKNLIEMASAKLVHDQFADKKPIPKGNGKSIEFRRFEPLAKATTALTEGVTPDGKGINVQNIIATVAQYGDFVPLSDMLELTAIDPIVVETTAALADQAGRTLDTVVRNVLTAGTNADYCPKIGTDGAETAVTTRTGLDGTCKLTVKQIRKTVAKLRAQNAPTFEDGFYIAIIHPYNCADLMSDSAWINAYTYGSPENLYKGEVGRIEGVRFVATSEARIWKDNSCPGTSGNYLSVFSTLIFGKGAYGSTEIEGGGLEMIVKPKGSAGTSDPLDQRSTVGWKASKVAKILRPEYLVRVDSCSTDTSAIAAN